MCKPDYNRRLFFSKGEEKGWSEARITRAWNAYETQCARADAKLLNAAPAPLRVGDIVRHRSRPEHGLGTIKAECDGYFWVQWGSGTDPDTHISCWLERAQ